MVANISCYILRLEGRNRVRVLSRLFLETYVAQMKNAGQYFENNQLVFARKSENIHCLQQCYEILVIIFTLYLERSSLIEIEIFGGTLQSELLFLVHSNASQELVEYMVIPFVLGL